MGYCFPYQTHRCYCRLNDLHSVVFHYGISTYFVLPHTFPIVSTMGMVWIGSIPKPSPTTMGLLRISHHSLAFPYHPSVLLPLWDCYGLQSTIPFPYHPSLLLLIWDCYGLKTTIPFPYYQSIHTAAGMGILLYVSKHYITPISSRLLSDMGMVYESCFIFYMQLKLH